MPLIDDLRAANWPHPSVLYTDAADAFAKLTEYTGHRNDCQIMTHGVWSDPIPCTCGLSDLLKEIGHG